jgi:hypothetical protein
MVPYCFYMFGNEIESSGISRLCSARIARATSFSEIDLKTALFSRARREHYAFALQHQDFVGELLLSFGELSFMLLPF